MNSLSYVMHGLLSKASQLYQSGQLGDAASQCHAVLKIDPVSSDALNILGLIEGERGNDLLAEELFRRVVSKAPAFVVAYINLGSVLKRLGKYGEAIDVYGKAISLQPDLSLAYFNRGNLLREIGRTDEAFESFRKAAELDPLDPDAFNNCGSILWKAEKLRESVVYFDLALSIKPDHVDALINKATSLYMLGEDDELLPLYDRVLAVDPEHVVAIVNRGSVFEKAGDLQGALAHFRRGQLYSPDDANANWNESLCLLKLGDYETGWRKYESRWQGVQKEFERNFTAPFWDGSSLAGKVLLIHTEQGLGDTLQFCRYVPLLEQFGGEVIFEVPVSMQRLMTELVGLRKVRLVRRGDELPDFDFHCPLMSLPFLFKTSVDTIPADVPYLAAPADAASRWREKLSHFSRRRVGIVWRTSTKGDRTRSISPDKFQPLFDCEVDFFVVQKELSDEEKAVMRTFENVHVFDGALSDFAETAALISCLDGVVSIDTSIVHLAGAMNKPVWLLLPYIGEWRWFVDREDSPWYPTARIFRQGEARTWGAVIDAVAVAVKRAGN